MSWRPRRVTARILNDLNSNGKIEFTWQCIGGHEKILFLPKATERTPFKCITLN
jgi:hypothetical protein